MNTPEKSKVVICPYCGETQQSSERCRACSGLFEPLSQQATLNAMGPWFIRDLRRPFQPGCSYETLVSLIERGMIAKVTVIRGPTTRQLWNIARRVPGIAHLFGYCYACEKQVETNASGCPECGAIFGAYLDRDYMGLPGIKPMPWEADIDADGAAPDSASQATPGGRLSSFASNEELRNANTGPGVAQATAPSRPVSSNGHGSSDEHGRAVQYAASLPETDSHESRVTNALERQVARQSRTVRTLTAIVILGAISLATLAVIQVSGLLGRATTPASPVEEQVPVVQDPVGQVASPPTAPFIAPEEPAPTADRKTVELTPTVAVDSTADGPWREQLRAADAKSDEAHDESLDVETRIASCEAALELFTQVQTNAPEAFELHQLAESVAELEQLLERLQLKAFFP